MVILSQFSIQRGAGGGYFFPVEGAADVHHLNPGQQVGEDGKESAVDGASAFTPAKYQQNGGFFFQTKLLAGFCPAPVG